MYKLIQYLILISCVLYACKIVRMRNDIVQGDKSSNVKEIDKDVKNMWKWDWLEKMFCGVHLGDHLRKIAVAGKAFCILCDQEIKYDTRGFPALEQHVSSSKHRNLLKTTEKNYSHSSKYKYA